jgi:hypothetical protein
MSESSPSVLKTFLSELAANPERLAAFQQDPNAAMDAANLSQEQKDALLSGDE